MVFQALMPQDYVNTLSKKQREGASLAASDKTFESSIIKSLTASLNTNLPTTTLPFSMILRFFIPCLVRNFWPWLQTTTTCRASFTSSLYLLDMFIHPVVPTHWLTDSILSPCFGWNWTNICSEFKVHREGWRCSYTHETFNAQQVLKLVWTWLRVQWAQQFPLNLKTFTSYCTIAPSSGREIYRIKSTQTGSWVYRPVFQI